MSEFVNVTAQELAARINRRRFLRRAANTIFYAVSVTAAGGGLSLVQGSRAWAIAVDMHICEGVGNEGKGCPDDPILNGPCGPSRCCNFIRAGAPSNCNCAKGALDCKTQSDSPNCYSNDLRAWPQTGCWSCRGDCFRCPDGGSCRRVTTCCDCKTNQANCNDPNLGYGDNRGRCINYDIVTVAC
jgi:hypothetical protein